MLQIFLKMFYLLLWDGFFLGLFVAALIPLAIYRHAAFAVLKRNFVGYFSNPTGYVFLCVFVLLTSIAAFWPDAFFSNNLATLDQLSWWLPLIMLVFIPAITMNIWAEERRQGTDELLLTIPADDLDIVLGKFLAAVSIFSASLWFSQLSSFTVLAILAKGDVDIGLFVATYFGYWTIGLLMLSIGMVASFLTRNLTVAFILGALFNAPLVFAVWADVIAPTNNLAQAVASWSVASQFGDFSRGVISLSSMTYFVMIAAVGVYVSIVFIGSRHWIEGRDDRSQLSHYLSCALFEIVFAVLFGVLFGVFFRFLSEVSSGTALGLASMIFLCTCGVSFGALLAVPLFWRPKLGHFLVRTLALILIAVWATDFFTNHDMRRDVTQGRVSSLSPDTKNLLQSLRDTDGEDETESQPRVVNVEAYISSSVPEQYARTKIELISLLNEMRSLGGKRIRVQIYDNLEPSNEGAIRAEEQHNIRPEPISTRERGELRQHEVFLGAAFTCGLEKVVVPFFGSGIPVEYELVRSICTVAQSERKKIGVVRTDAQLFAGFSFMGPQPQNRPQQQIIDELRKQYEVEEVDPNEPIETDTYDALMVVQPSSLTPPQLENLLAAIRAGQPTAIFEDPMPFWFRGTPGTSQPKMPRGGMMGMRQPPEPKGDIQRLWDLLGIEMIGEEEFGRFEAQIIWQQHNPYPLIRHLHEITDQWVFVGPDAPGADKPLNPDERITSGMDEILFPFPGAIFRSADAPDGLAFTSLVTTGAAKGKIGTVTFQDMMQSRGDWDELKTRQKAREGAEEDANPEPYILAAIIRGDLDGEDESGDTEADDESDEEADDEKEADDEDTDGDENDINVVVVSDIDMLHSAFFQMRAHPAPQSPFRFENVTFVLNVLDDLAGDDRFIEIRKRRPRHSTLKMIEEAAHRAGEKTNDAIDAAKKEMKDAEEDAANEKEEAVKKLRQRAEDLQKQQETGTVDFKKVEEAVERLKKREQAANNREEAEKRRVARELKRKLDEVYRERDQEIRNVQNRYKFCAWAIPPIPPLLVALAVFLFRWLREREGVSGARRR